MEILFFTDVHSGEDSSEYYVEEVEDLREKINFILDKGKSCDVLVCCGDLSFFGEGLKESMNQLKDSGKTILIIPGNHEDLNELEKLCNKNVIVLHKKHLTIKDVTFAGYGGGGFDEKDKNLEKWANDLKSKVQGKLVLFTHAPPYNTKLDKLPLLDHRGSKSIRKAIEELKPTIFASGHFHETFLEEDVIGESRLINPGDKGIIIKI
ncbi:hypothetical protein HOM13_03170 [Candidatus Woesearchaeota archaeon]|jgi:hypothetical protein|nr:hypothetical protein [Candidatus Woesearchaeota archaeon]MBT5215709.1 hypothetical protein [Candidatus Woesearchaeota archaeon]